jgi:hypothetical protein
MRRDFAALCVFSGLIRKLQTRKVGNLALENRRRPATKTLQCSGLSRDVPRKKGAMSALESVRAAERGKGTRRDALAEGRHALAEGRLPNEQDAKALDEGNGAIYRSIGYTDQEYGTGAGRGPGETAAAAATTTKEETAAAMAKVNDVLAKLNLDSEDEEESGVARPSVFLSRAPRMPDPRCVLQSRLYGLPPLATQARMRINASTFSRHFAHAEKVACRLRIGP